MGKLELSDEERQRRSERMRQLHAEGKAGGQFGKLGGRPRKKRASEVAVEKAQEEGLALWERLREIIYQDDSLKLSLDAIKHVHALEEQERKVVVEEEVRYDQLKHNELAEVVIGQLFELIRSGDIDPADVIEGEILAEGQALGTGEVNGRVEEETEA